MEAFRFAHREIMNVSKVAKLRRQKTRSWKERKAFWRSGYV